MSLCIKVVSIFEVEETNLMCIYSTDSCTELTAMQQHLAANETKLKSPLTLVICKLADLNDEDFDSIAEGELAAVLMNK
jgi:hypothetical protein